MPQTPYSIQTVRNLPEVRELKNVHCLSSLIWLEKFLDKRNYELIQIDTDSLDLWLSWDSLEEAVFPAMAKEFRACKKERNAQEPGLFMLEFEDICGIALCSKCYFMEEEKRKVKVSPKGSLKRQNKMRWERFKAALEGVVDTASHKRRSENERSGDVHLSAKNTSAERLLRQIIGPAKTASTRSRSNIICEEAAARCQ